MPQDQQAVQAEAQAEADQLQAAQAQFVTGEQEMITEYQGLGIADEVILNEE